MRARILDETRHLIAENGAAISMSDVAAAAGVSRQAVYLHFPSRARLWLDARAPGPALLEDWWNALREAADALEQGSGVEVSAVVASQNRGTQFDARVRDALVEAAEGKGLGREEVVCFAGHDAGVIAERRPAGMVLVMGAVVVMRLLLAGGWSGGLRVACLR